jgi:hypothetical protein
VGPSATLSSVERAARVWLAMHGLRELLKLAVRYGRSCTVIAWRVGSRARRKIGQRASETRF